MTKKLFTAAGRRLFCPPPNPRVGTCAPSLRAAHPPLRRAVTPLLPRQSHQSSLVDHNGCVVGESTVKIDPSERVQHAFDLPREERLAAKRAKAPDPAQTVSFCAKTMSY